MALWLATSKTLNMELPSGATCAPKTVPLMAAVAVGVANKNFYLFPVIFLMLHMASPTFANTFVSRDPSEFALQD